MRDSDNHLFTITVDAAGKVALIAFDDAFTSADCPRVGAAVRAIESAVTTDAR